MGFVNWFKEVLGFETAQGPKKNAPQSDVTATSSQVSSPASEVDLPMEASEKELVAILAACIVGQNTKDANLHIQKIRRVQ